MRCKSHEEYGTWPRGSVSSHVESGEGGDMWLHWCSVSKAPVSCSGWEINTSIEQNDFGSDQQTRLESAMTLKVLAGEIVADHLLSVPAMWPMKKNISYAFCYLSWQHAQCIGSELSLGEHKSMAVVPKVGAKTPLGALRTRPREVITIKEWAPS